MRAITAAVFITFATAAASPVSAADLYGAPYEPQPELRGSHDWSGSYAGVHGGYGWGKTGTTSSMAFTGAGGVGGGAGGLLGGLLGGNGLLNGLLGIGGVGGGGVGGIIGGVDNILCGLLGIGLAGCSNPGAVTGVLGLDDLIPGIFDTVDDLVGGIIGVDGFDTVDLRGSDEIEGFFGGFQIGRNWQDGSFVYGVEADISVADMKQSSSFAASASVLDLSVLDGAIDAGIGTYEVAGSIETGLNFFGTLRGRMGFAWDRLLVFGTGGIAFGDVDVRAAASSAFNLVDVDLGGTDLINLSQSSAAFGQASDFMVGYVIGGGVEYAFNDRVSGKLEYAYMNLGETSVMLSDGSAMDVEVDMHLVKGGMNVKF